MPRVRETLAELPQIWYSGDRAFPATTIAAQLEASVESAAPTNGSLWKLYGWWVLFSTIGWAAGPILFFLTAGRGSNWLGTALGMVGCGAVVGLAQWLVLRLEMPRAGWWILTTAMSIALGLALCWGLFGLAALLLNPGDLPAGDLSPRIAQVTVTAAGLVLGLLFGAAAGMGQSKSLPWHINDVGWWVLATTVGAALDGVLLGNALWALGGMELVQSALHPSTPFFAAVGMGLLAALVGPLKGIATGIVLVWLRKNRPL